MMGPSCSAQPTGRLRCSARFPAAQPQKREARSRKLDPGVTVSTGMTLEEYFTRASKCRNLLHPFCRSATRRRSRTYYLRRNCSDILRIRLTTGSAAIRTRSIPSSRAQKPGPSGVKVVSPPTRAEIRSPATPRDQRENAQADPRSPRRDRSIWSVTRCVLYQNEADLGYGDGVVDTTTVDPDASRRRRVKSRRTAAPRSVRHVAGTRG